MKYTLPEHKMTAMTIKHLKRNFEDISREMEQNRVRGEKSWWQPKKLRLQTTRPLDPEDGAVVWIPERKCLAVYHAGERRWYRSVEFVHMAEDGSIDGGDP